jgi:hypothetical protein
MMVVLEICSLYGISQTTPPPADGPAQMQRLSHTFVGNWSIIAQDEPTPQHPKGLTYSGVEIWSEPGGGPVMEGYHDNNPVGEERETALFWWDTKSQKYLGLWCAPINDEGCNGFDGWWNSNQLVLEGSWLYQGKRSAWREVFAFPGATSFVQTLYLGDPGTDLKLASTIHAKRTKFENKP